jgi:hypothetical protein
MVKTPNTAQMHKELADALDLQISALSLVIQGFKRQSAAHRAMEVFFTAASTPLGTPLPVIAVPPAGPDPDFDDDAPGQEQKPDEAAP